MTESIDQALEALAAEFDELVEWEDRYQHVIDLGKSLPGLSIAEQIADNRVRGCASQVWLVTEREPDGAIAFRGDSDGQISRGIVAVLLRLYSHRTPSEILAFDAKAAMERLGLAGALSAQRSNGLFSMVERIRRDAAAAG